MSANGSGDDTDSNQGGAGRREVAWRVFAAEYDDADFDHSESDEERAPNYVVTPTGARINRLFAVGVLTEVEQVSDDVLRARVVDPTGAFVLYAGQYQPDEMAFLENANPPAFVAVTGKARTFQPDDSDRVFTSIRPESINEVDAETRDRWAVQTAEQTLSRVSTFADALDSGERGDALREALEASDVDTGLASGIPLALDHYGTTKAYLAEVWGLAVDSARVVADEMSADDVGPLGLAPGEGGDEVAVDLDYSLTDEREASDISELETEEPATAESEPTDTSDTTAESAGSTDATESADTDLGEAPESGTEPETEAEAEPETTAASDADLGDAPTSTVAGGETEATAETDDGPETDEPPEVEDAEDAAELQEEIGDDEPPTVESEQDTSTDESFAPETGGEDDGPDLGTAGAGDEMYEFDDEEREEVEEEYGLEFSSGSEVGEPGEAEMDVPEPDSEDGLDESTPEREAEPADDEPEAGEHIEPTAEEAPAGSGSAAADAPDASIGEDSGAESAEDETTGDDETASGEQEAPENLEETVMETMRELNEGDGVEREVLLAAVVDDYDVTPADVEDALESALMGGRCYESGEDTLKPI
jgi:RPA family protein